MGTYEIGSLGLTMKLSVTFGMALDGVRDLNRQLGHGVAEIGHIVCGPMSLLQLLETHLGLCGAEVDESYRISAYCEKVRAADAQWCRDSFSRDNWGTAARLLALRDELVMMGWSPFAGDVDGATRLGALSRIELAGDSVPAGIPDRLWAVAKTDGVIDMDHSVDFVDDARLYPAVWKKIFLRHFGKEIGVFDAKANADTSFGGRKPRLTVVRAPDETRLAVELARYLRSGGHGANRDVAVIASGDTTLLDGILTRYGLPRIGHSTTSVYRESLEVVPLLIELMWKPFKPELLISLLGMSIGPMSHGYAKQLIRALNEAPGIGGECWDLAWKKIFDAVDGETVWRDGVKTAEPVSDRHKAEKKAKLAEWRRIFEEERFSATEGIPVSRLSRVLLTIRRRFSDKRGVLMAGERDAAGRNARVIGLGVAIEQIDLLVRALAAYGDNDVSRNQLDRIMDSVMSVGLGRYDAHEEVSECRVVRNPGQLTSPVKTILWWDFTDRGRARQANWLESELSGLPGADDAGNGRLQELKHWRNSCAMANEHLVCFVPERKSGEEVAPHPFYDNLVYDYGGKEAVVRMTYDCAAQVAGDVRVLADREIRLIRAEGAFEPVRAEDAVVSDDLPLEEHVMSPTEMDMFVMCPYSWYLKYRIGLTDSDYNDVLNDSLVKGKLAHKVMELLFTEVKPSTPAEAAEMAGVLFERLVPQMAAMYESVDRREDRRFFRESLCRSVATFFSGIAEKNLEFVAAEIGLPPSSASSRVSSRFNDVALSGRLDLVLRDHNDHSKKYVVDYKWTNRPERYKKLLNSGKSVQLAIYDFLLSEGAFGVSSGYYFFPQEKLLENDGRKQNDRRTLEKAVEFCKKVTAEIRGGRLRKGVPDEVFAKFVGENAQDTARQREAARGNYLSAVGVNPAEVLDKAPNCRFCRYRQVCGEVVSIEPPVMNREGGAQ